jgi:hypothetical protein
MSKDTRGCVWIVSRMLSGLNLFSAGRFRRWASTIIGTKTYAKPQQPKRVLRVRQEREEDGALLSELSAISQNQPVVIEIKGFKTSHFKESKTALLDREKLGAKEHVECPQSEPANNDTQLGAAWLVAAANCQGVGGQSRNGGSVFAAAKTGHFDHRL